MVAILIKSLDDPEYHIRSTAAGRLGGTGDKSAVPKLKQALNDPDTKVRRHAARSLRDLTGVDYSDRIKKR
ncbi:MAG: HEAT repeat domain-containing protein [Planctomycetota bacterium]|nr:MAG: HEAT repeat domain-containing protein [Planctomycetota bacterium]